MRRLLWCLSATLASCSAPGSTETGALTTLGTSPTTDASPGSSSSDDATSAPTASTDGSSLDPDSSDTTETPLPPLPCDDTFTLAPPAPDLSAFEVEVSHPEPLPFVDLTLFGPNAPTVAFIDVVGTEPYRWAWQVSGHVPGEYTLEFGNRTDEAAPLVVHSTCQVRVDAGGGEDSDTSVGDCTCADKACGEDDGCGTPCSGGHRDASGAISDCRLEGNCGCGVEPNDNMQCTGDGLCRVRCSCDCLPPVDVDASEVSGLDFGGSCAYVFEQSGDPTVWDETNGVALCPLDYDPQGEARCTECPPCHRPQAPECDWAQYCTCIAPMYYEEYSQTCCAAGPEYCY